MSLFDGKVIISQWSTFYKPDEGFLWANFVVNLAGAEEQRTCPPAPPRRPFFRCYAFRRPLRVSDSVAHSPLRCHLFDHLNRSLGRMEGERGGRNGGRRQSFKEDHPAARGAPEEKRAGRGRGEHFLCSFLAHCFRFVSLSLSSCGLFH